MEKVAMKKNGLAVISETPEYMVNALENFTAKLNTNPSKTDKVQGFDTLPISTVETELDEDYAGLWQTQNFRWQVVANEIVGSIDLLVFHPIARMWLTRSGSASVMIMQKSGSEVSDISAKIKNTLVKDFPKLEIMCIKSAAKKLGNKYGRNLNRKWADEYETVYSNEQDANDAIDQIGERFSECKTMDELMGIWKEFPEMQNNDKFKKTFGYYRNQLTPKK